MSRKKLTARQRKGLRAAQRLLGPQGQVVAYAAGRANARMTTTAWVVVVGFAAVAIVVAAVYGVILIPGVLLGLVLYSSIRPYRGVAVTDYGVVLLKVSLANGRPSRPMVMLPWDALSPPYAQPSGTSVRVPLGEDWVSLRRAEHLRLLNSVPQTTAPSAAAFQ